MRYNCLVMLMAVAAALLLAGASGAAQGQPAIRVNVDLVQFDVIVTDSKGTHVADLKPEEFEIYENGKPQRITNLAFIPGIRAQTALDINAPQPSYSMSRAAIRPERVSRTMAVVVDDLGLSEQSFMYVRGALETFLDRQAQPDNLIAIVTTSGRLGALQRLTADKRILRAAADRLRSVPNHRAGVLDVDFCEPGSAERNEYYSRLSIAALRRVVDGLQELPGRKSILLFSEGLSLFIPALGRTPQCGAGRWNEGLMEEYSDLLLHANRSGIAIHTIAPRRLIATFETAEYSRVEEARPQERMLELTASQGVLSDMAQRTGGISITNENDLSGSLTRVMNEETGYYLIAYKPSPSRPGKHR